MCEDAIKYGSKSCTEVYSLLRERYRTNKAVHDDNDDVGDDDLMFVEGVWGED